MAEEPTSQAKQVRAIYSIMNGIENNLGGGEGVEGLYGSITGMHMQRMLAIMREHCGLDASSHLVDIGAGLGRPLLHALVTEGISGATGIELDYIKCMKAEAFLKQTANTLLKRGLTEEAIELPVIECNPVEKVRSLDPATHAYSFWEGVPIDARVAFGRLFAASRTLRSVTVVQRSMRGEDPEEVMEYGYCFGPVSLVETLSVSMSGSNRHFTAYVFNKTHPPAAVTPHRRGAPAARAAPSAEVVDVVATPPRSADNPKLCSKNSEDNTDSGIDVSKKLELAAEVASSSKKKRERPAVLKGRDSRKRKGEKIKKIVPEAEDVDIMTTTTRLNVVAASPRKKAKAALAPAVPIAMSTRSSPRKPQHPQQKQQKIVAIKKTKNQNTVLAISNSAKKSPVKPKMSREARGLLGSAGVGFGMFGVIELLEGSAYPRTRHALIELQRA